MKEHDTPEKPARSRKKLQLMMDEAEIAAIDDWQFKNRIPTRASAIRELIRRALAAETD